MINFIKRFKHRAETAATDSEKAMNANVAARVLFVCMGNICRSPSAEGVFRKLVESQCLTAKIDIDSAGTISYHVGEAPDTRAQAAAKQRDIDLSGLRARQFTSDDFYQFDYIIAMDQDNLRNTQALDPGDGKAEVALMLDFAENFSQREVPDPYYGGKNGFQRVLDMIEDASLGLLDHVRQQKSL